ncbi:MAG: hypothetical protein JST59_12670 [Actinobacteria bacterium]|nr:hypothetical protein [Actinomycetota bacterium]
MPSGGAILANFARGLDRFAFDLVRGDASETLASAIACLAPELDTGGAFQQLAVALVRVTPTKPLKQRTVEVDFDR